MSQIVTIDNIVIPDSDIVSIPMSEEGDELDRSNLLAGSLDIVLDNSDGNYSKFNSLSIFFGSDFYNKEATIFDDELDLFTFKGLIKDIRQDDKNKQSVVKVKNYIRSLKDHVLNYFLGAATNVTPAEHMLNIIKDEVAIPEDSINEGSFNDAINIQDGESVYMILSYATENGNNALAVLNEIKRITNCDLYVINNQIYLFQWTEYNGILGTRIKAKNMIPATFKTKSIDTVINDYSVAYISGLSVVYKATDYPTSLTSSQNRFGVRTFNFPKEKIESSDAVDYRMLFKTSVSAKWAGNSQIDRNINMIDTYKITLDGSMGFLHANDQIDINDIEELIGEPSRIKKLDFKREKNIVEIEAEFLNIPNQRVSRDTAPPAPVELIEVIPLFDSRILVKWTLSQEADHIGYNLYFTPSPGVWESEFNNLGRSPNNIVNPLVTVDGFAYIIISQLNIGTEYFFKVTSYDSSFNESADSNVLSAIPAITTFENIYMLQGDFFIDGLTLDISNTLGGTVPTGFKLYDSGTYNDGFYSYNAIYESGVFTSENDTWTSITFETIGTVINYQIREFTDSGFGSWSVAADAIGIKTIALGVKSFQIRFLVSSALLSDNDYIILKEVL